ncbi:MAG: dihydrofolate reductase [Bauldia sp.]|nr:dihydrofolate reductase [Bauldia sp.]
MRKLSVFNNVSLDGYFTGRDGGLDWAERSDPEWNEFTAANTGGGGEIVLGRVTYQLMASYWPTPAAMQENAGVAIHMNGLRKYVFTRTLKKTDWANTTLLHADPATEIARLKGEPGEDMVILGSGTIVAQLAAAGLIDEYQFVVVPVALGAGRTMFEGVPSPLPLRHRRSRIFANGNLVLWYDPSK